MNIFFLHDEPDQAARYYADKHVGKILIECCQMMSTSAREYGFVGGYADTHVSHPMTLWVGASRSHYEWCWDHAVALADEWIHRYGKAPGSMQVLPSLGLASRLLPDNGWCNPPRCIPDEYKVPYDEHRGDTSCHVASYRWYYACDKRHLHKWTERERPAWLAGDAVAAWA